MISIIALGIGRYKSNPTFQQFSSFWSYRVKTLIFYVDAFNIAIVKIQKNNPTFMINPTSRWIVINFEFC